jgi:hypothetical protein
LKIPVITEQLLSIAASKTNNNVVFKFFI